MESKGSVVQNVDQILSGTQLFGGLSRDQLNQIGAIAKQRSLEKGETIFMEGDQANGFYIVVDGMVKIFKVSAEGKEQILHIYGPGNPFGEAPVFAGSRFPANAQAVDRTRLFFFPRGDFISLITTHPGLALNMLAILSMRLRQFTVQVESLSLKEVPGRLASYLIYLAEEQKNKRAVNLPISKGQIASLLGTIPETLSRIFNKMASQQMISVKGAEIAILDWRALESLARSGRLN